ncbi:MAG: FKBP-type peptidyl-prolyl cis-trans isomerase [Ardenticatenaceae bacterium]
MDTVKKDKVVDLHYTLRRADGQVEDSTTGEPPLPYLHGAGNIIPGLESALEGRGRGDKFTVTLAPAEAYGEYDSELVDEIPLDAFPEGTEMAEGDEIFFLTEEGEEMAGFIESVTEETLLVNYNHPLAGETLTFEVEIAGIRDATPEELEHGHAHDPYAADEQEEWDDEDEEDEDDDEWDDEEWDEDDEEWDEDDEEWDEEENGDENQA